MKHTKVTWLKSEVPFKKKKGTLELIVIVTFTHSWLLLF